MLGTGTPNRARINLTREVWSNVSETISGPRLYGENDNAGNAKTSQTERTTNATGPGRHASDVGHRTCCVLGGAVGGVTWSKKSCRSRHS